MMSEKRKTPPSSAFVAKRALRARQRPTPLACAGRTRHAEQVLTEGTD
jgi:hypothetical protein